MALSINVVLLPIYLFCNFLPDFATLVENWADKGRIWAKVGLRHNNLATNKNWLGFCRNKMVIFSDPVPDSIYIQTILPSELILSWAPREISKLSDFKAIGFVILVHTANLIKDNLLPFKKSHIQETLNLLTFADSSTDTMKSPFLTFFIQCSAMQCSAVKCR